MKYLIDMNKNLRVSILFIGFVSFILLGIIVDNLIVVAIGFCLLALLIYTNIKYSDIQQTAFAKSLQESLNEFGFEYTDSYITQDYLSGIAINPNKEKLAVLNRINTDDKFTMRIINFFDILESSINENNVSVTRASKNNVAAGALIGGVLAGGVGAVIGGLSGDKISSDSVVSMTLSIIVDDLSDPIQEIVFLNTPTPIKKNTAFYNELRNDINKWHKTITVILKRNELNTNTV